MPKLCFEDGIGMINRLHVCWMLMELSYSEEVELTQVGKREGEVASLWREGIRRLCKLGWCGNKKKRNQRKVNKACYFRPPAHSESDTVYLMASKHC